MIFVLVVLVALFLGLEGVELAIAIVVGAGLEVVEVAVLRGWSGRLERRRRAVDPEQELVGQVAEVARTCRPQGQVRLRGELWEAFCAAGADEGDTVRVEAVNGLSLVVAPAGAAPAGS